MSRPVAVSPGRTKEGGITSSFIFGLGLGAKDEKVLIFGLGQVALCEAACSFVLPDGENTPLAIIISPLSGIGNYTLDIQTTLSD